VAEGSSIPFSCHHGVISLFLILHVEKGSFRTANRGTAPSNGSKKLVPESIYSPQRFQLDDAAGVIKNVSTRSYLLAKVRLFQPGRFFLSEVRWVNLPWLEARFVSFMVCESNRMLNHSITLSLSACNCISIAKSARKMQKCTLVIGAVNNL
jgi:hypothetical protein